MFLNLVLEWLEKGCGVEIVSIHVPEKEVNKKNFLLTSGNF